MSFRYRQYVKTLPSFSCSLVINTTICLFLHHGYYSCHVLFFPFWDVEYLKWRSPENLISQWLILCTVLRYRVSLHPVFPLQYTSQVEPRNISSSVRCGETRQGNIKVTFLPGHHQRPVTRLTEEDFRSTLVPYCRLTFRDHS